MAQPVTPGSYPPAAFAFRVDLLASASGGPKAEMNGCFQEVSGLRAERSFEEVEEGGENRFLHRLPGRVKWANLVLKRGIVTKGTALSDWFDASLAEPLSKPVQRANLSIFLLGPGNQPVIAWGIANALPVRWEASPMQSEENKVMTETLEVSYNYFERINLGATPSMGEAMRMLKDRLG